MCQARAGWAMLDRADSLASIANRGCGKRLWRLGGRDCGMVSEDDADGLCWFGMDLVEGI